MIYQRLHCREKNCKPMVKMLRYWRELKWLKLEYQSLWIYLLIKCMRRRWGTSQSSLITFLTTMMVMFLLETSFGTLSKLSSQNMWEIWLMLVTRSDVELEKTKMRWKWLRYEPICFKRLCEPTTIEVSHSNPRV